MTYCVAAQMNEGIVFASDSRTNAGVDNIATFKKMTVWQPGDRVLVLLTAGNLAVCQSAITLLNEGVDMTMGGVGEKRTMLNVPTMLDAARLVGAAVREIYRLDGEALRTQGAEFNVSFILGGQIEGGDMRLYQIYAAGNFVEATVETPYFQLGETKYGKPIIDRIIRPNTVLRAATKCILISIDSTLRSNLTVGMPLDIAVYRRDSLRLSAMRHIEEHDRYFNGLRNAWMEGIRTVFKELPDPDWMNGH